MDLIGQYRTANAKSPTFVGNKRKDKIMTQAAQAAQSATPAATSKPAKAGAIDYVALGASLLGNICEVSKGKEHAGELVKVFFISKGRAAVAASKGQDEVKAKRPIARAELSTGEITFFRLDYLSPVKAMDKKDMDRLVAAHKAEQEATMYVYGRCTGEGEKAVGIDYRGWMRPVWFPKETVTRMDGEFNEMPVFEVPVWKVKQAGLDAYDNLLSKQDAIEAALSTTK
jgi:hypothetical protein